MRARAPEERIRGADSGAEVRGAEVKGVAVVTRELAGAGWCGEVSGRAITCRWPAENSTSSHPPCGGRGDAWARLWRGADEL